MRGAVYIWKKERSQIELGNGKEYLRGGKGETIRKYQ